MKLIENHLHWFLMAIVTFHLKSFYSSFYITQTIAGDTTGTPQFIPESENVLSVQTSFNIDQNNAFWLFYREHAHRNY